MRIYDVHDTQVTQRLELPVAKAIELDFSPHGTYLTTWERPLKRDEGEGRVSWSKNMRVWNASSGQLVGEFERRQLDGCFFQFTEDEAYAVRQVSTELHVFDARAFDRGVIGRVRVEAVGAFSVGPGARPAVALFTPEKKGAPAFVRVYTLAAMLEAASPTATAATTAQKSFFKADKVTMKWNSTGTSLLVMTATDHDQTGKSYYGETNLYMLSARGDFDCRVSLDKEGPIHDFAWSPNAREFLVIYGYMPAKAVIFSYRVNVIAELGTQPRNLIAYNPQGRLFCLAGFGNLAGTVDIWDREQLQRGKLFSLDASNSSVLQWSPDGQFLLTGTLSPRLRVENGVRVWHCTGALVHVDMIDELYQATWRPRPAATTPPFPAAIPAAPAPSPAAAELLAKRAATARPTGAYRPPGARGSAVAEALKREEPARSYVPPSARGGRRSRVPGAPPAREEKQPPRPTMGAADVGASSSDAGATEKKVRSLTKKLKAIEQLKERRARGETLEQTQLQKMDGEAEIRRELEALNM